MTFDDNVNKILKEAYFSSPHEKATGIKRQVNLQEDEYDVDQSEFRQTKNRKKQAMHLAVLQAANKWYDEGEQTGRKAARQLVDDYFNFLANPGTDPETGERVGRIEGDVFTTDDHDKAFLALGHATQVLGPETGAQLKYFQKKVGSDVEIDSKPAMSTYGHKSAEDKLVKKLRKDLGGSPNDMRDPDIETDEDKLAQARAKLKQDLAASRSRTTFR